MKNRVTPGDDWPIHNIEILNFYDSLASARKSAEDSQYSSAQEEPKGRGYRKKRLTAVAAAGFSKINSDDSSDDNTYKNKIKPAASLPKLAPNLSQPLTTSSSSSKSTKNAKMGQNHHEKITHNNCDIIKANTFKERVNSRESTDDEGSCTINSNLNNNVENRFDIVNKNNPEKIIELQESGVGIHNHKIVNKKPSEPGNNLKTIDDDDVDDYHFNIVNKKLDQCLHLLGSMSVKLKDVQQQIVANTRSASHTSDNKTLLKVKKALPLNKKDDITKFESNLKDDEEFNREFIKIVGQVGGGNGKEHTERVLNFIFSQSFAQENTWEGKKNKYKVAELEVVKICEGVMLDKFSSFDSAEFSKVCNNWFRLGNQRAKQQPAQVQKKSQLPVNAQ